MSIKIRQALDRTPIQRLFFAIDSRARPAGDILRMPVRFRQRRFPDDPASRQSQFPHGQFKVAQGNPHVDPLYVRHTKELTDQAVFAVARRALQVKMPQFSGADNPPRLFVRRRRRPADHIQRHRRRADVCRPNRSPKAFFEKQLFRRQPVFAAGAALLFSITLILDLLSNRPEIDPITLWVLLAFCLALTLAAVLLGRRFPPAVGLSCVIVFTCATIYFFSPWGDEQAAVSSAPSSTATTNTRKVKRVTRRKPRR